jgi:hypothetical protein
VLLYAHATQAGLWFGSHRIIARGRLAFRQLQGLPGGEMLVKAFGGSDRRRTSLPATLTARTDGYPIPERKLHSSDFPFLLSNGLACDLRRTRSLLLDLVMIRSMSAMAVAITP